MGDNIPLRELIQSVINVAEKGAVIARLIRRETSLIHLLTEEKTGSQKNERFVEDFKTLTDVLIQEVVKEDLYTKYGGMRGHIYGEESNKLMNALGDTICVEVKATQQDTCTLLEHILDGNHTAASLLSKTVHEDLSLPMLHDLLTLQGHIDVCNLAIWIDPIDGTGQYIKGADATEVYPGLLTGGLQNVLVLIGVYDRRTGKPVIGVVNQPFALRENDTWIGQYSWGVDTADVRYFSPLTTIPTTEKSSPPITSSSPTIPPVTCSATTTLPTPPPKTTTPVICTATTTTPPTLPSTTKSPPRRCTTATTSSSTTPPPMSYTTTTPPPMSCTTTTSTTSPYKPIIVLSDVDSHLHTTLSPHFDTSIITSAGYKLLATATGLCEGYVITKPTTFVWDTCAPHALLLARGGGIVDLAKCLDAYNQCHDDCSKEAYQNIGDNSSNRDCTNNSEETYRNLTDVVDNSNAPYRDSGIHWNNNHDMIGLQETGDTYRCVNVGDINRHENSRVCDFEASGHVDDNAQSKRGFMEDSRYADENAQSKQGFMEHSRYVDHNTQSKDGFMEDSRHAVVSDTIVTESCNGKSRHHGPAAKDISQATQPTHTCGTPSHEVTHTCGKPTNTHEVDRCKPSNTHEVDYTSFQLSYNITDHSVTANMANTGGVIAYRDEETLHTLITLLATVHP